MSVGSYFDSGSPSRFISWSPATTTNVSATAADADAAAAGTVAPCGKATHKMD